MSFPLHTARAQRARVSSPRDKPVRTGPAIVGVCRPKANPPWHSRLHEGARSQGPFLRRRYPASSVIRPCPTPADIAVQAGVEAATLLPNGSPPITRITLPACRAHYPGGSNGCARRLLPRPCGLPRFAGGSASASLLSRPAQALLTLRPVGLLSRPRRPLSRGFSPSGYPSKPLVSYRNNRQFSGWNLPPLVTRAFGAHCKNQDFCMKVRSLIRNRFFGANVWCKTKRLTLDKSTAKPYIYE